MISKNNKINILFLIDELLDRGGTETHLADVVQYLNKEIFNCTICSFDSDDTQFVEGIRNRGTEVNHIPVGRLYGWNAIRRAFEIFRLIRKNKFDIVQTFHFKADTYGVFIAKCAGVPKIISSRRDLGDLKYTRHIILNKLVNPLIDHFIMVCKSVANTVQNRENIPAKKITVIYNGVDLERFSPNSITIGNSLREELGFGKNDFVIGSVAHFREEKAYHIFFEAIECIRSKIKDWKVLILGEGPLENQFKSYCKDNNLDKQVTFMGYVVNVQKYMQIMDVICLVPNKNEGFSNAILEGMAMGKPMIATGVGGNAESIVDGETGIIIPPDDSKSLVDAIIKLYNDIDLKKKMGEKGRKRIERNFLLLDMIRKIEQLYLRIYGDKEP